MGAFQIFPISLSLHTHWPSQCYVDRAEEYPSIEQQHIIMLNQQILCKSQQPSPRHYQHHEMRSTGSAKCETDSDTLGNKDVTKLIDISLWYINSFTFYQLFHWQLLYLVSPFTFMQANVVDVCWLN